MSKPTTRLSSSPRRPMPDFGDEQVDETFIRRRHDDCPWELLGDVDSDDNPMLDESQLSWLSSSSRSSSFFSRSSSLFGSVNSTESGTTSNRRGKNGKRRGSRGYKNLSKPQTKVIDFVKRSASKLNDRRNDILNDWNNEGGTSGRKCEGFESILCD